VIFALTLSLGLTAESLLTQGVLNHYYTGDWVLLAHVAIVLGCWLAIVIRTHSWWMRTGGIFGCIWAIFAGIGFMLHLLTGRPGPAIVAYLNAVTYSALLGSYICLSIHRTSLQHWDAWFFRLMPILGSGAVALAYFLTPADARSLSGLENTLATTALFLCLFVWWLRPACWQTQPAPTFFFGAAPAILLLLTIPGSTNGGTNFLLLQVVFLSLLLGTIRTLQSEVVH